MYSISGCWINKFNLLNNLYCLQWKAKALSYASKSHSYICQSKIQTQDFLTPTQALYYLTQLLLGFCKLSIHINYFSPWLKLHILAIAAFSSLSSGFFLSLLNLSKPSLLQLYKLFTALATFHFRMLSFLPTLCNSIPRCTPKKMCTCRHKEAYTGTFTAALIITPNWNLSKCLAE